MGNWFQSALFMFSVLLLRGKHDSKLMKHNSKLKVKLYGNLLYLITVIGYISWLPYGPSSILKLLD